MVENDWIEAMWIEPAAPADAWTLTALAQLSGLTPGEVRELVEYGALQPDNPDAASEERWIFSAHCAVTVRTAVRLRRDFDLDPPGLALVLALVERIRASRTSCAWRARCCRAGDLFHEYSPDAHVLSRTDRAGPGRAQCSGIGRAQTGHGTCRGFRCLTFRGLLQYPSSEQCRARLLFALFT